jgi:hypothetical protein
VRGHKTAQSLRVFVIHGANFVTAKIALFFNLGLSVFSVVRWSHEINLKFKNQNVKYRCFAAGKTL